MQRTWRRLLPWLLVPLALYFVNVEWQTRRGEAALLATALEFRPLDVALSRARASGRPVLVDFSAIWCPSCRRLHETVFSDPAVQAAINAGYELSLVDYESPEAPAFMTRYAVTGFPTLLVLDADGRLLRRLPISDDPEAFRRSLQD